MGSRPDPTVPLRWRVFALLALLASLVVASTALTMGSEARLIDQEREQEALHRTALVSERLMRSLDGQVAEVRGFAITGAQSFLQRYAQQRI
ncbi:MAG: hypothetical protein M3211_03880, partial [Actinomycetota bacterium]|nr:hypothetical protein [Actinomycetota bacterium]